MEAPEYEQYGLTEEQWDELTEEEREAYRSVGEEENQTGFGEEAPNE